LRTLALDDVAVTWRVHLDGDPSAPDSSAKQAPHLLRYRADRDEIVVFMVWDELAEAIRPWPP
jgi:hypothetical protein